MSAYSEGFDAALSGEGADRNPYISTSHRHAQWAEGFTSLPVDRDGRASTLLAAFEREIDYNTADDVRPAMLLLVAYLKLRDGE